MGCVHYQNKVSKMTGELSKYLTTRYGSWIIVFMKYCVYESLISLISSVLISLDQDSTLKSSLPCHINHILFFEWYKSYFRLLVSSDYISYASHMRLKFSSATSFNWIDVWSTNKRKDYNEIRTKRYTNLWHLIFKVCSLEPHFLSQLVC